MDTQLLPARISDLQYLSQKTSTIKYLGFLTTDELSVALKCLGNKQKQNFFGGYAEAQRTVLAFLPDWCNEPTYPITALTFVYRKCDELSHRDFLGALMALGITRETVGDILIEKGRAVVFVLNDIADFIISQINKIGRVGVSVSKGYTQPLPNLSKKVAFSLTVASMRLDCVVSALCGCSRNQASQTIIDGCVFVNSICIKKPTHNISANSNITIRKKGRFEITSCDEVSKKGRIILKYDKYV